MRSIGIERLAAAGVQNACPDAVRRAPRRPWAAWIISVAVGIAVGQVATAGAAPLLVATREVASGPHELSLPERVGTFAAGERQRLAFEVSGRVAELADEGAEIAAGAPVARLEDGLERAELRRIAALLREASEQLDRLTALRASDAATDHALEQAQTRVEVRRAELESVVRRIEQKRIVARWPGTLVERRVEPGEVVNPGALVGTLMRLATLKLEVGVPGYAVGRVAPGQRAWIRTTAHPAARFAATVHAVAPAASDGSHLFEVELAVPNPGRRLRPGMTARAEIVTRVVSDVVAVPLDAVVERDGERVVFFVVDGRARSWAVAHAPLHRDQLLVPGPLPSGALVVRGQRDLFDGAAVRVDNRVMVGGTGR